MTGLRDTAAQSVAVYAPENHDSVTNLELTVPAIISDIYRI
jgi:hypothetical protein